MTSATCASGCSIKVKQSSGNPFWARRDFMNGATSTTFPPSLPTNTLNSLSACNSFQQQQIHLKVRKNDAVSELCHSSSHSRPRSHNPSSRVIHSISTIATLKRHLIYWIVTVPSREMHLPQGE